MSELAETVGSGYQQPASATIVPSSIAIQAVGSGQFRIVAHLRSGQSVFRQHSSQPVPLEEALRWIQAWGEDPADCLWRLFGWRATDIDAAIKAAPKTATRATGHRSPPSAYGNLSLADLGL